jgi:hypothetical protein
LFASPFAEVDAKGDVELVRVEAFVHVDGRALREISISRPLSVDSLIVLTNGPVRWF